MASPRRHVRRTAAPRRGGREVGSPGERGRTARRGPRAAARGLGVALAGLGAACALAGGPGGSEVRDLMKANAAAHGRLRFGMTKAEAAALMGEAAVRPPWANPLGLGPQVVRNPFDRLEVAAPGGETYEVLRYAVALAGEPRCPFVRGEAELVPLIFLGDELVGWRWSYLESALQRRLRDDEQGWKFGSFCPGEAGQAPD